MGPCALQNIIIQSNCVKGVEMAVVAEYLIFSVSVCLSV